MTKNLCLYKVLYIGNKSSEFGRTRTAHETLAPLLSQEVKVKSVSGVKNVFFRVLHILYSLCFAARYNLILVDTYSTSNFFYALAGRFYSKIFNVPYILILHGGSLPELFERKTDLISQVFNDAALLISPSFYLQSFFYAKGFKVVRIPNVLETAKINFKERKSVSPKILWVRSLEQHYNPKLAIDITRKLRERGHPFKIILVGPERDLSQNELANESESFVQFTGLLSREKWLDLANEFDLFLNTSTIDNYPITIVEAMASGLIVCSTSPGDIPEMVEEGQSGFVLKSSNADDFVDLIEKLYLQIIPIEGISGKARKFAEAHNWSVVKKQWIDVLNKYAKK